MLLDIVSVVIQGLNCWKLLLAHEKERPAAYIYVNATIMSQAIEIVHTTTSKLEKAAVYVIKS